MYTGYINHRCDASIILNNCMVCNMYKGGNRCRYVEECVLIETKKEFV